MQFLGKIWIRCSINAPEMFIKVLWASDNTYVLYIVQEGRANAETERPSTARITSKKLERASLRTFTWLRLPVLISPSIEAQKFGSDRF
jgi:hypothetical protein